MIKTYQANYGLVECVLLNDTCLSKDIWYHICDILVSMPQITRSSHTYIVKWAVILLIADDDINP